MGSLVRKFIGFDDRWVRLLGIPIVAASIPPLFFQGEVAWQPDVYLHSLVYTTVIWEGCRQIILRVWERFPRLDENRMRLLWTIGLSLAYTGLSCTLVGSLACLLFPALTNPAQPAMVQIYGASYLMLLLTGGLYESVHLFSQLRTTVLEKEKVERAHLASQLEGLRSQVNPHFLFNSLNTLIYLIPEDPGKSVRFVQHLSKVYRYLLENRDDQIVPLAEELGFLEAYVFLLKERFGENLFVEWKGLEAHAGACIVTLSLQMLLENAIKHNIISAERPLKIDLSVENGQLIVRNNLQLKKQVMDSTGVGLENIRSRYRMLTGQEIGVIHSPHNFTVALPLIRPKIA